MIYAVLLYVNNHVWYDRIVLCSQRKIIVQWNYNCEYKSGLFDHRQNLAAGLTEFFKF